MIRRRGEDRPGSHGAERQGCEQGCSKFLAIDGSSRRTRGWGSVRLRRFEPAIGSPRFIRMAPACALAGVSARSTEIEARKRSPGKPVHSLEDPGACLALPGGRYPSPARC